MKYKNLVGLNKGIDEEWPRVDDDCHWVMNEGGSLYNSLHLRKFLSVKFENLH